ncbi:MAG TPA: hypothetical protein VF989_20040 [Polyangiaceae bacterium]
MKRLRAVSCVLCCAACQAAAPGNPSNTAANDAPTAAGAPTAVPTDEGAGGAAPEDPDLLERERAVNLIMKQLALAGEPPAGLALIVVPQPPGEKWFVGIVNTSSSAYSVVADMRLLSFGVMVPGKKKAFQCRLPDGLAAPKAVPELVAVLEPDQLLVDGFDPRLYCFASEGQTDMVPGALMTPRFGWAPETKTVYEKGRREQVPLDPQPEPFVAQTPPSQQDEDGAETTSDEADDVAADAGSVGRLKELQGATFALGSEYADWARAGLAREAPAGSSQSPLSLSLVRGSDVSAEKYATIGLTLKNRSKKTLRVYFRRELVSFDVLGPDGVEHCDPQPDTRSPDPLAFLALSPGRSIAITSMLAELCPLGTFEHAGLYLVQATFDANYGGKQYGLDAFTGTLESERPVTIRVRTGPPDAAPTSSMQVTALPKR